MHPLLPLEAYDGNIYLLFEALQCVYTYLATSEIIIMLGCHATTVDSRLYPIVVRFDAVYPMLPKFTTKMTRRLILIRNQLGTLS